MRKSEKDDAPAPARMNEENLAEIASHLAQDGSLWQDECAALLAEVRQARKDAQSFNQEANKRLQKIMDLNTEIAALRERVASFDRLTKDQEISLRDAQQRVDGWCARAEGAEADRERLAEIIRLAPHGPVCRAWDSHGATPDSPVPCSCWKAAALGEERK